LAFAAEHYAALAEEALLREVRLTPKPGLVDADNCGAHRDMDLAMFEASAACLKRWFSELFLAGARQPDEMPVLQELGLRAEAAMRRTTGGVNTHKGSIFTFGLILGALGASCRDGKDVFDRIAGLVREMTPPERDTHGGMARQRYGAGGARAEAAAGLPTARGACQVLRKEGDLTALLWLMARCEDTNLLYRGGERGLRFVQRRSRWILRAPRTWRVGLARRLDEAMIRRNLSPGGCADLLAAAIFLDLCGLDGPRPEE